MDLRAGGILKDAGADVSVEAVRLKACEAAFGQPLVVNNLRSMVVEAMLAMALPAGWEWCSADWAGWDFEHDDGTRLEVEQSAARQTWKAPVRPSPPQFDIAERTGFWEGGATWIPKVARHADVYVFAHHPVVDDTADHRDPAQRVFHVVPTSELPPGRRLGLAAIRKLCEGVGYDEVAGPVEAVRRALLESQLGSPPSRG